MTSALAPQKTSSPPALRKTLRGAGAFLAVASATLAAWTASALAAPAAASSCKALQEWTEAREANLASAPTIKERAELQSREFDARGQAGERIFAEYLRGTLAPDTLKTCVARQEDRELLQRSISNAFLSGSLRVLKSTRSPALLELIGLAEQEISTRGFHSFKALSHEAEQPIQLGPRKAGFHRGRHSLFMDFEAIAPEEWLFIFVHELAHKFDPRLQSATVAYGDPAVFEDVFRHVAKKGAAPLSKVDQDRLRTHLRAGLDRGLLAEVRAWTLSFSLYEAGVHEGLWGRIDWVDALLQTRPVSMSFERFTFEFLDPRFGDPEPTGFYGLPVVRQELAALREELRSAR
ncbi:MAG: hypothetical protein NDJ89_03405 [Oligoflexia bacterium]|nr:hypothetical protein [Oligoflexia bacterium]